MAFYLNGNRSFLKACDVGISSYSQDSSQMVIRMTKLKFKPNTGRALLAYVKV